MNRLRPAICPPPSSRESIPAAALIAHACLWLAFVAALNYALPKFPSPAAAPTACSPQAMQRPGTSQELNP